MKTHTPTPWAVSVPPSSMLTRRTVHGPDGEYVALIGYRDFSVGQDGDLANAALIVHAVNAHEDLVAALRLAAEFVDRQSPDWPSIRDALAKVEAP